MDGRQPARSPILLRLGHWLACQAGRSRWEAKASHTDFRSRKILIVGRSDRWGRTTIVNIRRMLRLSRSDRECVYVKLIFSGHLNWRCGRSYIASGNGSMPR